MEKHFKLTDSEFEKLFKSCKFNPSEFTHEAHLRLAWININKYGIEQAEKSIQELLQNYVEYLGAKGKYNTTLTIAATKAVYHFMLKSDTKNFKDFIVQYPRLKTNFKELMAFHYNIDILNSERAKSEFLEPDILAFD